MLQVQKSTAFVLRLTMKAAVQELGARPASIVALAVVGLRLGVGRPAAANGTDSSGGPMVPVSNKSKMLLKDGKFFTRSKPQYKT